MFLLRPKFGLSLKMAILGPSGRNLDSWPLSRLIQGCTYEHYKETLHESKSRYASHIGVSQKFSHPLSKSEHIDWEDSIRYEFVHCFILYSLPRFFANRKRIFASIICMAYLYVSNVLHERYFYFQKKDLRIS